MYKAYHHLKNRIRSFFDKSGYIEVDTPILVSCPGSEVYLQYFKTKWIYQNNHKDMYLRSSPEIHMKQILADGLEKIYQISSSFRNGLEFGNWHHPEFLLLEWYEKNMSFNGLMFQTVNLLHYIQEEFLKLKLTKNIKFKNFKKFSVKEVFKIFADIDLIDQDPDLSKKAIDKGFISVNYKDDFDTAFYKILIDKIEPEIKKLNFVILYDYPTSQAALSKIENGFSKRFEIYLQGVEICNGFLELTDYKENVNRFEDINKRRKMINKEEIFMDKFFKKSLKTFPSSCGNALGLNRLMAVLFGMENIDKTIGFRDQFFKNKPNCHV